MSHGKEEQTSIPTGGVETHCSAGFDRAQLIYTSKGSSLELLCGLGSELDQELQRNLQVSQGGFFF